MNSKELDQIRDVFNSEFSIIKSQLEDQQKLISDTLYKLKELTISNRELTQNSKFCSLTNILSRRTLDIEIDKAISDFIDHDIDFALLVIDIDFFKDVNDKYNHENGDRVLKQVVNLLQLQIRQSDVIGRWGGEEFVIVLFDTNKMGINVVCNKLLESVRTKKITILVDGTEQFISKTISIGATLASSINKKDVHNIFSISDVKVLSAKENGRDQVIF
jgi:diguanylate cyclase (GGDEF)-like protein